MRVAGVCLGIVAALTVQTTLTRLVGPAGTLVNLVLVVTVYVALSQGPAPGALTGAAAGLLQDMLSGGVIGVGGLAYTVVGFAAGVLGAQFIVASTLPRAVVFFLAALAYGAVFLGLYAVIDPRAAPVSWRLVLARAGATTAIGVVTFALLERMPDGLRGGSGFRGRRR